MQRGDYGYHAVITSCGGYVSSRSINCGFINSRFQGMGVGKEGPRSFLNFEHFGEKRLFSWIRVGKNKSHHIWPPLKNVWKNPLVALPWTSEAHVPGSTRRGTIGALCP